jgi:hypothetical protein
MWYLLNNKENLQKLSTHQRTSSMVFEEPLALHAVRVMKLNAFCLRVAMKYLLRLDVCTRRLGIAFG